MPDVDIAIIGNGLATASLLCALKNSNLSIAILDKKPRHDTSTPPSTKDARPISLAKGSLNILEQLGISLTSSPLITPLHHLHVSEQHRFGHMEFHAQEFDLDMLGAVIPFTQLEHALHTHAAKKTAVQHSVITELDSIEQPTDKSTDITVHFKTQEGKQSLSASLLIGADGTHSFCREQLSLPTQTVNRGDHALIFELTLSSPHQHRAYQRFTPHGSMALLPLFNPHHMRCVWIPSQRHQTATSNIDALRIIQTSYQHYLPAITDATLLNDFPLQHVFCKKPYTSGAVLLGNAAHTFYPLTAQGYNLTLRDVVNLAQVLQHAQHHKQPLGSLNTLGKYHHQRKNDQTTTGLITQTTQDLFGLHLPLLGPARGLGLLGTQLIRPLKKRLAYRMMGLP